MYPGGLKSISQEKLLATRPERVIEYAVKGMLPHNAHGAKLLKHLKVYAGPDHPHAVQVNAGKGKTRALRRHRRREHHGNKLTATSTARAGARPPSRACGSTPAPARSW